MLTDNYKKVLERIDAACRRAGRERSDVTLVAVSKTKPVQDIQTIYDAGQREFGENKVQELTDKIPKLPSNIDWHLIGHLQTNKVKYIVDKVKLIHSVDTLKLAETISKEAMKHNVVADVLIEVNVAGEESKFGVSPEETLPLVREIAPLEGIRVRGLMTIAPFVSNPEDNRVVFAKLKQLSVDIASEKIDNVSMSVLSMGMTNDYEVAVEEGATHVRVGTAIFGERNYGVSE